MIAFCGVHFMAETASILSPEKTVLIPDLDAGCSLADSIDAEQLRAWKAEHPGARVVMYVNTSAEVKAETDYCCTSSNAVKVVEHIWAEHGPETEILFGPDMWLGAFVERETGIRDDPARRARFHVWDGECHVHAGIRPDDIAQTRAEHPEAEFLIHPECGCATQAMEYVAAGDLDPEGVHMLSTSGMLKHVEEHPDGSFIVATENGMLYPLQQAAPRAEPDRGQPDGLLQIHEDDHAAEAARLPARDEVRGQRPGGDRRAGAGADRAHGRDRVGPPRFSPPLAAAWASLCRLGRRLAPQPNKGAKMTNRRAKAAATATVVGLGALGGVALGTNPGVSTATQQASGGSGAAIVTGTSGAASVPTSQTVAVRRGASTRAPIVTRASGGFPGTVRDD